MNRILLLAILPLALAGCAVAPMHVDVPDISRSEAVTVRDARPPTEARREAFSLLVTSDAYGLIRAGDMNSEPSVLRLLQHRVYERAGAGAHVTVDHLVMYRNLRPQLKAGAWGALLGPIGAVIAATSYNGTTATSVTQADRAQFDALAGDAEWKRALFAPDENPKKVPVDVTYLDLDVDGRRAFVRVVSPEQADDGRNPFLRATETAIRAALDQLSGAADAAPVAAAPAPTIATPPTATAATTSIAGTEGTTSTSVTVAAASPEVPVASTSTAVTVPAAAPMPMPMPKTAAAPLPAPTTAVSSAYPTPSRALPLRHLDAQTVDGAEWVFPALNPLFYRDVTLAFRDGRVDARNQGESTSGTYTVADDKVCVAFASERWGRACYAVVEATAGAHAHGLEIMELPSGVAGPLTIR